MNIVDIESVLGDELSATKYLINNGVLKERLICSKCLRVMKRVENNNLNSNDVEVFACQSRFCRAIRSIRSESIFEGTKERISFILYSMIIWSYPDYFGVIKNVREIPALTLASLKLKLTQICYENYLRRQGNKIGGKGRIVDIDASVYVNILSTEGLHKQLIFGGIEINETTLDYFVEYLMEPTLGNIIDIICKKIHFGTIIRTNILDLRKPLEEVGYFVCLFDAPFNCDPKNILYSNFAKIALTKLSLILNQGNINISPYHYVFTPDILIHILSENPLAALIQIMTMNEVRANEVVYAY